MSNNPFTLPNAPHVTIREILIWIADNREIIMSHLAEHFDITSSDASVRLLKLSRWGYLRRKKSKLTPKVYHYCLTKFGKKTVKKWRR